MRIAIVGYSGGGRSTLFELLTGVTADRGAGQSGQRAMALLEDERLEQLAHFYETKKITHAALEVQDTPGLVQGASADNARRLGGWREADALLVVLSVFAGGNAEAEFQGLLDDLLLADMELLSGVTKRLRATIAKPRPDREEQQAQLDIVEPLERALNDGVSLRSLTLTPEQQTAIRSYGLLTLKPRLLVVNVAETAAGDGIAETKVAGQPALSVCLKLEKDLQDLSPEDRAVFQTDLGIKQLARGRLVQAILDLSGQMVFYTAGPKEVRSWLLPRGGHAVDAAGAIHSDLARGFIRAEIITADDLLAAGSERDAKAQGRFHVEGRDYVIQNGDVVLIRFSV